MNHFHRVGNNLIGNLSIELHFELLVNTEL